MFKGRQTRSKREFLVQLAFADPDKSNRIGFGRHTRGWFVENSKGSLNILSIWVISEHVAEESYCDKNQQDGNQQPPERKSFRALSYSGNGDISNHLFLLSERFRNPEKPEHRLSN